MAVKEKDPKDMKGVKVLVRSKYREVRARTGFTDDNETHGIYRQFHEHEAFMTPAEAEFLINSDENQAYIEAGAQPMYWYPAGQPLFLEEKKHGKLEAPLAESSLATTDPRQAEAARRREERLAKKKKAPKAGAAASQEISPESGDGEGEGDGEGGDDTEKE